LWKPYCGSLCGPVSESGGQRWVYGVFITHPEFPAAAGGVALNAVCDSLYCSVIVARMVRFFA